MRYKLSATDTKRNGVTIAEVEVDRPSRDAALGDGIVQLLSANNFPPEALALYRGALDRSFTRDEALDQILADFGVQFFMKEVPADAPAPPPNPSFTMPQPQPTTAHPQTGMMSPRQMLRAQLANLKVQERALNNQFNAVLKQYHAVKVQVDECRALLRVKPRKTAPAPAKRTRRAPMANGAAANVQ